tara:strand:+ start:67 stop:720 length:654 start_codon:yes stop_codon:yes gene_type:complete
MAKEKKQHQTWSRRAPDNIFANGELIIESPKYGTFTILYDLEDEEKLKEHRWNIWRNNGHVHKEVFYARTLINHPKGGAQYKTSKRTGKRVISGKRQFKMYLHRYIMDAELNGGKIVDHKDGNTLNNKRANLRFCTASQNSSNARSAKKSSSGYIGVSYRKKRKGMINEFSRPWLAHIGHNNKTCRLGCYTTAEEAARVRDAKALELHGEYARLNFP